MLARLHDRRRTDVRDLPAGGRPVTLVWIKRVWRCMEPDCPRQTWTETSEHIRSRASLTERARREACRRVGQDGETVARVAGQYGAGWQAIMNAVVEYGRPLVEESVSTYCWLDCVCPRSPHGSVPSKNNWPARAERCA